ncbi:hypothetical protein OG361_30470 [Streptomyces sp. NBC_00090]|uniref:hypothetical protein n=1 Tax=Streptomyces sp. NBC_00090 TaxID=2903619 RepID=UPI00324F0B53
MTSTAPPSAPAAPEPGYVDGYEDRRFTLTATEGGCLSSVADLDEPAVESGEVSMKGEDMSYGCGDGLSAKKYFGAASASLPTPENCARDAKANSVGEISDSDMNLGQAFCVITDEDAVVWMKLVKKSPGSVNGDNLTFLATLWKPAGV